MKTGPKSAQFRYAAVETASEAIGKLAHGERVFGLTKGQFSLLDLLRAIIAQTGPADLVLSTWTAGLKDTEHLGFLSKSGSIRSLLVLVDRSFPSRHPDYAARLLELFGPDAIRVTQTHAKFALVSVGDWRITIRTSMNLNFSPRWEQFELDDDPAVFAFYRRLVDEIEATAAPGLGQANKDTRKQFEMALGGDNPVAKRYAAQQRRLRRKLQRGRPG